MKLRNLQSGSAAHIIIIVVLILAVLGALGYIFWQNFASKWFESSETNTSQQETGNTGLPQSHTSSLGKYTVNYPSGWTLEVNTNSLGDGRETEASTLTSPDGTTLNLGANTSGDRGGTGCPEETPFKAGNVCPSFEVLSTEKLAINNVYGIVYTDGTSQIEKKDVYLVSARYGATDGKITYLLGVTADDGFYSLKDEINVPRTGIYYPDFTLSNYDKDFKTSRIIHPTLSIYASSASADFLTNADADVVKEIIRSLRINI